MMFGNTAALYLGILQATESKHSGLAVDGGRASHL